MPKLSSEHLALTDAFDCLSVDGTLVLWKIDPDARSLSSLIPFKQELRREDSYKKFS